MSFDSILGVVVCPTLNELMTDDSVEHRQLLSTFYTTCMSIRDLFQQSLDAGVSFISEQLCTFISAQNIYYKFKISLPCELKISFQLNMNDFTLNSCLILRYLCFEELLNY